MKNKSILLLLIFILNGCIAYHRTGSVVPNNWSQRKSINSGGYFAQIKIDTNDNIHINSTDKTLKLELPTRIKDERCSYVTGFIIPFYFSDDCGNSWTTNNNMLGIKLSGIPYSTEFINYLNISLISNGIEYKGSKTIGKSQEYAYFIYPIEIGSLENGTHLLIIKYKSFTKTVPIKYKMEWNGLGT